MLNVKKVKYENDFTYGCGTCDYGSEYISNIEIELEDYGTIRIETSQMYNYTLTESDYMQLLGNSKDLDDFYKNMFKLIKQNDYEIKERIVLQEMEMKINGNQIDIYKSCGKGKPIYVVGENK